MPNYIVNTCDLLKRGVFSSCNWQNSFGCTLELAFIHCSIYNLYSALLNLREKHSPFRHFPPEISTECFDISASHI